MNAARRNKLSTGVAALIAGLLASHVALADPPALVYETVARTIDVRGLDLASPLGAQQAYRQIAAVAKSICRGASPSYRGVARVKQQQEYARCFDQAVEGALARVTERTGVDLERVAGADGPRQAGLVWR